MRLNCALARTWVIGALVMAACSAEGIDGESPLQHEEPSAYKSGDPLDSGEDLRLLLTTGTYGPCDDDTIVGHEDTDFGKHPADPYQGTYPITARGVDGTARVCHFPLSGTPYTERLYGKFEFDASVIDAVLACFILAEADGSRSIVIEGYVDGGTGVFEDAAGRVSASGSVGSDGLSLDWLFRFD